MKIQTRKPPWLKIKLPGEGHFAKVNEIIRKEQLYTVCQSARCPNLGECWSRQTATFMILGNTCTRNCRFCAVTSGQPEPVDVREPSRVANAVKSLNLKYAVVTSVTRDDLPDGGAFLFAETIRQIRIKKPDCRIEVLIPDFNGSEMALLTVLKEQPDVLNHNVETVPGLYSKVRPQADYRQSLKVLKRAAEYGSKTKSGIMVGIGESVSQVHIVMKDLLNVNCKMLTIGQYLQPSKAHVPVDRYVTPEEFDELKQYGLELGFDHVESGPLVRSSYHADEQFNGKD
ncbi:lipoyl synthase [candidate division KSB1 bacterium]|nr:lipoyl synthase [candidate division KSB1 bacterium]